MLKFQLISTQEFIFDTLLDNLLWQFDLSFTYSCNLDHAHACIDALSYSITTVLDVGSQQLLQLFKDQIPDSEARETDKLHWCWIDYLVWIEELKTAVSFYRKMQSDWHFKNNREILKRYYNANQFLIETIDRSYEITIELRQEIETAMLSFDRRSMEKKYKTQQKLKIKQGGVSIYKILPSRPIPLKHSG